LKEYPPHEKCNLNGYTTVHEHADLMAVKDRKPWGEFERPTLNAGDIKCEPGVAVLAYSHHKATNSDAGIKDHWPEWVKDALRHFSKSEFTPVKAIFWLEDEKAEALLKWLDESDAHKYRLQWNLNDLRRYA
jgi:hypothetical protein